MLRYGVLFFFISMALPVQAGSLNVLITGIPDTTGRLLIYIYDQPGGFPAQANQAMETLAFDVVAQDMWLQLGLLPEGEYAIAVIHDENNNNELDTNFLGIPKEAVGVSGNKGGFPSFRKARFFIKSEQWLELRIEMKSIL